MSLLKADVYMNQLQSLLQYKVIFCVEVKKRIMNLLTGTINCQTVVFMRKFGFTVWTTVIATKVG